MATHTLHQRRGRVRRFALVISLVGWTCYHYGQVLHSISNVEFTQTILVRAALTRPVGLSNRCGSYRFLFEKEMNPERHRYARRSHHAGECMKGPSLHQLFGKRSDEDDESALADRIRTDPKFLQRNKHWILFVDDEEAIRQSVGDFLYDSGYQVTACADANAAVEVCRNATSPNLVVSSNNNNNVVSRGPPSCVVADIRMPGGPSGLELLQWIRAQPNPALHRVPVVMLTAKGLTADRIAGYQAGADVYLSKPFYPDELLSVVDNLIARRQEMVGDAGAMVDLQQELTNIQLLLQEQRRTKFQPTDVY